MALLPTSLDYTDRDKASLLRRLRSLIRSVFPAWTDDNVATFANLLVEKFAFVADVLGFYQDNQGRETRWATATQRRNLISLAKLIGFRPATASAASADVVFTLGAVPAGNVVFTAGTTTRTPDISDPVVFRLPSVVTIAAGQNPPTVIGTMRNSDAWQETSTSTGLPNQRLRLGRAPFLDASIAMTATNGAYAEVADFLDSTSTDRHFTVSIDQDDRATIAFGDGVNGAIPFGTIAIAYETGGGEGGNVEAGAIRVLDGQFADSLGNPVRVTVTNPLRASGGIARETNAHIRLAAPASLRALTRAVSRQDFEEGARRVAGVARALMLTSDEDPSIPENSGILFVVPGGGGLPSAGLKAAVKDRFISRLPAWRATQPAMLTFRIDVRDPVYLVVTAHAVLRFHAGVNPAAGAAAVRSALAKFFALSLLDGTPNPEVDFGANLVDADGAPIDTMSIEDVRDVVHDVPEVLRVEGRPGAFLLNGGSVDLPIARRQFPVLGAVTIVDAASGRAV